MKFLLLAVDNPEEFGRRFWDTYGFDYDTRAPSEVWAFGVEHEKLKEALTDAGIEFTEFEREII